MRGRTKRVGGATRHLLGYDAAHERPPHAGLRRERGVEQYPVALHPAEGTEWDLT